ncbi:hypothetical protein DWUX_2565 [Desulfovibrio diazotrophicus]|nr:hypothetical protein DWUX_2565 [Desulfovibrio diazotrophicus]
MRQRPFAGREAAHRVRKTAALPLCVQEAAHNLQRTYDR